MKRLCAVMLSLIMIVTGMSIGVFAGEGSNLKIQGGDSSGNVKVGDEVFVYLSDIDSDYGSEWRDLWKTGELKPYFSVGGNNIDAEYSKDGSIEIFYYKIKAADVGKEVYFVTLGSDSYYNRNTNWLTIISDAVYLMKNSVANADGSFTLAGCSYSSPFDHLEIYNSDGKFVDYYSSGVSGKNEFSFKFSVSKYDPGIYTMKGVLKDNTKLDLSLKASDGTFYKTYFRAPITEKPAIQYNSNFFSTGYNYISFRPFFTVNPKLGGVFLQLYDTKTKKWGDLYGPYDSYQILRTDYFTGDDTRPGIKIQPNRTYHARVCYGKEVKYNGYTFFINGPYSNTVSLKTGKSTKPSVKSIKIKAIKQKKTKLIQRAHWDVNGKWVPYKESYIWTTKYKVTVKLKKKPGTKGLMIGSKKIKGNKKTYTATFTDSGKLKGKKIKIGICTYNDTKVGGYGKVYSKKVKVK